MASLSIRNIDDAVYVSLKKMAQQQGLSLEQKVRELLSKAVKQPEIPLGTLAISCFADQALDDDLLLPERHEYQRFRGSGAVIG
jgi:plasmid stability protein